MRALAVFRVEVSECGVLKSLFVLVRLGGVAGGGCGWRECMGLGQSASAHGEEENCEELHSWLKRDRRRWWGFAGLVCVCVLWYYVVLCEYALRILDTWETVGSYAFLY